SAEGALKFALGHFGGERFALALRDSKRARKERNVSNVMTVHDYWARGEQPRGEASPGQELEQYVEEARSGKFDLTSEYLRMAAAEILENGCKLHPAIL